jgi:ADP-L-glycero-D-manno-heptose 6-epimerase
MIILTGAAGFIGSVILRYLNDAGIKDILAVDDLGSDLRWRNLANKQFTDYLHKDELIQQLPKLNNIQAVIHMGACSSTTERDVEYLMRNNYRYTKILAEFALSNNARFIYASSGATYGNGELGFDDDLSLLKSLKPLNAYGFSKHLFDLWAQENKLFDKIVGLKFFNVFGPNEAHKGDQRSMVHKAWGQIKEHGAVNLFRSIDARFGDGEQTRDFVYVKDCAATVVWLLQNPQISGLFNLGSGTATTWNSLINSAFSALGLAPKINYIETPEALRSQYQNYTKATMSRLKSTGCPVPRTPIEVAVKDYLCNYLEPNELL